MQRISWNYVWLPAVLVVIGVSAAALFTARQERVYRATARVIVAPSTQVEGVADRLRSLQTLESRSVVATLAAIPGASSTLAAAAESIGRSSASLAAYRIQAAVEPYSNILQINVEGTDPAGTAVLANAVAKVTAEDVRSLYRVYAIRTLAEAVPPKNPISPDRQRNYSVGATVGLFLGFVSAFVLDRLRRPEAVTFERNAPVPFEREAQPIPTAQ